MATFVVAHGAWSAGWAWKKMRPLMRSAGHELWTPTYTGLGERVHLASADVSLDTHIQDVGAVLETEATRIVPDFSKLEANVVQLPPFEVLGGTHPGDLLITGKRFFQYDYRLRLLAEDNCGADVAVPPLEVSYRVESKVSGGESVQGRDQSYALPRTATGKLQRYRLRTDAPT